MIHVLFVCLGNICRSPMAEFLFLDMVRKAGLEQEIGAASAATSTEALGCNIHEGTRKKLWEMNIPFTSRRARQIQKEDYEKFDYLIGMEARNVSAIRNITGGDPEKKIHRLLDYSGHPRDIADPWYTGDFDVTYKDLHEGCTALLAHIREQLGK